MIIIVRHGLLLIQRGKYMAQVIPLTNPLRFLFDRSRKNAYRPLSPEDRELVIGLEEIKCELENMHRRFDHTTDEVLLDALIYERKAAELKYKYYIGQMKVRGIVQG